MMRYTIFKREILKSLHKRYFLDVRGDQVIQRTSWACDMPTYLVFN